jgi:hypothetical protein
VSTAAFPPDPSAPGDRGLSDSPSPPAASPQLPDAHLAKSEDANLALLQSVWQRHDVLDSNATSTQRRFFFLRRLLSYMGVLVVLLAVVQPILMNQAILQSLGAESRDLADWQVYYDELQSFSLWALWQRHKLLAIANFLLILFPIAVTGLRAFAVKFDRGNGWILLRGSAEALKMETFYYRTQVAPYHENRNQVLAEKLQLLSERIKSSSVHQSAFNPYEDEAPKRLELGIVWLILHWPWVWINRLIGQLWHGLFKYREVPIAASVLADAEFSPEDRIYQQRYADLTPETYLRYRLEEQFGWYRHKAQIYNRQYQIFQTGVYVFGGLGTFLAATGLQNWVAVTAALVGALVNFLEYRRIEVTLIGYNQAADALYDIRAWWYSLSVTAQTGPDLFAKLVSATEETIRSEHSSWLQDMQDRLAGLYESTEAQAKPEASDPPEHSAE